MWDPETYPATIRAEIHDYDEFQDAVVRASSGVAARRVLELGTGAGETAGRVLERHPDAHLTGIDSSSEMLAAARIALPAGRADLVLQDLADPLPPGPFDLVVSALAVHHLEGAGKARLFADVARTMRPGSLFVLGDVVVPEDPRDALIENESGYDFPSRLEDQLDWLAAAGLDAEVTWARRDLAVVRATNRRGG